MNAFKGYYCEVDDNQEADAIKAEISRILKISFMPKYAKRPPRILVVGAPGSGKTTIAELLAKRYRLVFVSAGNLLANEIAAKNLKGQISADMIEKGEPVPDRIIGKLVEERLSQPDCRVNGWVLEGFPINEIQSRILRQAKETVSLTVELELDDDIILERCNSKKVDLSTGKVYNMANDQLKPTPDVKARLVSRPCDSPDSIKMRLKQWKSGRGKLLEHYKDGLVTVSVEKSIQAILESISEAVEN